MVWLIPAVHWAPWVAVAIIPGLANLLVAWKQLEGDCRFLPFFRPGKVFGFWVWACAQVSIPAAAFWFIDSLYSQPPIDLKLLGKSLAFGLSFVAFLNARTDTGYFTLNIKTFYSSLVRFAYALIAAKETQRAAAFWTDVETELMNSNSLSDGFTFLANYVRSDISLTSSQREERLRKLDEAMNRNEKTEQVRALIALMEVRRADLRNILNRFGCRQAFLKKYFQ